MRNRSIFYLVIFLLLVLATIVGFVSCDLSPEVDLSVEEELILDGYTPLELDGLEGIWYKNIDEDITMYIHQDEISHREQFYLDLYFYIEVNNSNEASLVIKSRTNSSSYNDMFLPKYVYYQPFSHHSTSDSGKVALIWGDVDYQRYSGTDDYYLWCESTVLNDDDRSLQSLIDLFDTEEDIYFYFANQFRSTTTKSLRTDFKSRIRDTLYFYVNHKDELKYHTPGDIPLDNTISFHANGGEGTMSDVVVGYDEQITLPINRFTKEGYTFIGWSTSSTGSVAYADESNYKMGAIGVNLYAKWTPNLNTITFHANYPENDAIFSQDLSTDSSDSLSSNSFSREGYTFAGWSTSPQGEIEYLDKEIYTMGKADVDLYAQWRMKFSASDGEEGDYFGFSVAISGEYAVVGAINDDDNGIQSGSVYIYHHDALNDIWKEEQKIVASDGAADDRFGYDVDISGDYIIVGAINDDDNGHNSGSAYIYKIGSTSEETINSEQKIISTDGAPEETYGYSVGISDGNIVVGSRREYILGSDLGRSYIYKLGSNEIDTMSSEQQIPAESHSWSVAVSGSMMIVGNSHGDGKVRTSGSATLYQIGNTRTETLSTIQKIYASDGERLDNFGASVAISGNHAIVGAIYDDDSAENAGAAYIYEIGANQDYTMSSEKKIIASEGSAQNWFGSSVAVSGDYVVIGDTKTPNTYIYELGFSEDQIMSSEQTTDSDIDLKKSLSISGDYAIIGSPLSSNENGINAGTIYFYNLQNL